MPITIQGVTDGTPPPDLLKAAVYAIGSTTILNGTGDNITLDSGGKFSFTPSAGNYLPTQLYEVALLRRSDSVRVTTRDLVWIASTDGTFTCNAPAELDNFFKNRDRYPVQIKTIDDTSPIFFFWPYGSGKTFTVQRSINGGALEPASGQVTDIGVAQTVAGSYRYKFTPGAGDKVVGSVAYVFTSSGLAGSQVVTWLTEAVLNAGSGALIANVPVSETGSLPYPLIRGNAYLAVNGRAFTWDIDPIPGFTMANVRYVFAGSKNGKGWRVTGGPPTLATILGLPKWVMAVDLPSSATINLEDDCCYEWSLTVYSDATFDEATAITPISGEVDLKNNPALEGR